MHADQTAKDRIEQESITGEAIAALVGKYSQEKSLELFSQERQWCGQVAAGREEERTPAKR